jgi:hypothetical protein
MNAGLSKAYSHLPLGEADALVTGEAIEFYRDWLRHDDPADPWWAEAGFTSAVAAVNCPVSMTAGWYDMFLPYQIDDFAKLSGGGRPAHISIGPWAHGGRDHSILSFQDSLRLFDAELLESPRPARAPVRVQALGSDEWLDFESWPPPGAQVAWYLGPGGRLSESSDHDAAVDHYRYDPADPTPGVGGSSLAASNSGAKDQALREGRPDVLVYSSEVFERDRLFVGPAEAQVYLSSNLQHTDLHVTICDVSAAGLSTNISSGIIRLRDLEGSSRAPVLLRLWPTGAVLRAGHRLRVQVASGAHPTYARNLGTGENPLDATRMLIAEQAVDLGGDRASRVLLWEVPLAGLRT